ncbi:hypothetical protein VFPPC_15955 [Pochonia chlamydosporia 170]|uniref:Uncharacterized protein n=1 Tax=Pochonia chlamydosporia 170 TaxID=1380566 RepID=A0A179FKV3_METCM|nr:hypothetical protein VFPPC_15955 [Pochonia chlamydosporia 170]OAQ65841.1 hypothetical protein VFPPC_15955 [Pochonia chlamydosporia 170]
MLHRHWTGQNSSAGAVGHCHSITNLAEKSRLGIDIFECIHGWTLASNTESDKAGLNWSGILAGLDPTLKKPKSSGLNWLTWCVHTKYLDQTRLGLKSAAAISTGPQAKALSVVTCLRGCGSQTRPDQLETLPVKCPSWSTPVSSSLPSQTARQTTHPPPSTSASNPSFFYPNSYSTHAHGHTSVSRHQQRVSSAGLWPCPSSRWLKVNLVDICLLTPF